MNAVEIEQAISDLALQPFDAAEFPFAFLAAFGNKDTTLRRLRAGNNNASDVRGAVLQRSNIHIATGEVGTTGAMLQALRSSPATAKGRCKFILATDGQTLEAEDLTAGETIACDYPDFPDHFGFFLPLAGISTGTEAPEAAPKEPAVPVRRSITPDHLVCLEDGRKFKSLKRHLRTKYNMSPEEYRAKWGLPKDYPMVAPNYSQTRSSLAKSNGLGRKPGTVPTKAAPAPAAKKAPAKKTSPRSAPRKK